MKKAADQGLAWLAYEISVQSICPEYVGKIFPYDKEVSKKYLRLSAESGLSQSIEWLCRDGDYVTPINRSKKYFKEQLDIDIDKIKLD